MSQQAKELFEFGPFRLDPEKRLLLRDNQPVPLPLKAFETLLVLVRHSEQVVLKEELMQAVWPDSFVEESNLSQNIFVLRKTLSAQIGEQRYIVTVPGRGYRFAEQVRIIPEDALVLQHRSRTRVVIDEEVPQRAPLVVTQSFTPASPRQWSMRKFTIPALAIILLLAAYALRPKLPPPRVTRIHQITKLGTVVHNTQLLTDGPRIYFRVWQDQGRALRSVSTEGGDVAQVPMPISIVDLNSISPSGSEFLEVDLGDQHRTDNPRTNLYPRLWRVPVLSGSPQPVGDIRAYEAIWSPDGNTIAYSANSQISRVSPDGASPTKLFDLPDDAFYLSWSPDAKRLRFSAADSKSAGYFLWQADLSAHTLAPLIPSMSPAARPWAGGWTADSRYSFYSAAEDGVRNIFAIREKDELFRRVSHRPVQLTNGPLTFYLPLPSRDGKRLFAVGEQLRGQILRYDVRSRQFSPYAQGISADHFAFSPDGQWMAYIQFPEGALIRSRLDGSERRQLTFSPMRAFSPCWSPDGSQIAFHAAAGPGSFEKIYIVSNNGGLPALATPASDDRQSYPSWSSNGNSIVFVSSNVSESTSELHILDRGSRQVSILPGTVGLANARISPDDRSVLAVRIPSHDLILYNMADHTQQTVAPLGDYPRWSSDGKVAYFNTEYFSAEGRKEGIYRWNVSTRKLESVLRYPDFQLTGAFGIDFAVTPDGSILLLKDTTNRDIYELALDLP